MKLVSTYRSITGIVLSIVLLALAGCTPGGSESSKGGSASGNKLDGVYHAPGGGPITITIKDGKATVLVGNESKTSDYKVEGNKLTILNAQDGNMVLTINDDGTLNSELGVMSRKP
jgi:hypothetical protein